MVIKNGYTDPFSKSLEDKIIKRRLENEQKNKKKYGCRYKFMVKKPRPIKLKTKKNELEMGEE